MAQPIAFSRRPSEAARQADLLQDAPIQHAEAILSAYELLELLHSRGILSLLRGLIGSGADVVQIVTEALDQPAFIRAIRNLLLLLKSLGAIPPDAIATIAAAVKDDVKREEQHRAPGLIQLFRRLRNEDSRHAVSAMLDVFENLGKEL